MRGKFSEISIPGTLVLIGLYGPRISTGALGFMCQVSSCDGPPTRNSMMQLVSFFLLTAAQPEHGKRAGMQKIAAARAIAKLNRSIGIQAKHPDPPLREVWLPF